MAIRLTTGELRISRLEERITGLLERAVESVEPETMREICEEIRATLPRAERAVSSARQDAKKLEFEREDLERSQQRWQREAEAAVKSGADGRAREALRRRMEVAADMQSQLRSAESQRGYAARVEGLVEELQKQLELLELRMKLPATDSSSPGAADQFDGERRSFNPVDDQLEALKSRALEEELAALKRRLE